MAKTPSIHPDDQRLLDRFRNLRPNASLVDGGTRVPSSRELNQLSARLVDLNETAQRMGADLEAIDYAVSESHAECHWAADDALRLHQFANDLEYHAGQIAEAVKAIRRNTDFVYTERKAAAPTIRAIGAVPA
jgi:hypothetical protein